MPLRSILDLVLLASLWGASFLFMRIATPEFGAIVLVEIRVVVASLFLLPIWYFRESPDSKRQASSEWRAIFLLGLLNSAIPFALFAFSTLSISGGYASIINATAPMWGAFVAWLWLQQRLSRNAFLGLLIGIGGVVLLVSDSLTWSLSGTTLGIVAALSATLFYGVAANFTAVKLYKVSPLSLATFSLVAASIALFPLAVLWYPQAAVSAKAWLAVLAMGILSTGLANILYFRLIASVGSTKAITVAFLIPVFAMLWGAFFLGEEISVEMVFGSVVILTGTALVTGLVSVFKPRH